MAFPQIPSARIKADVARAFHALGFDATFTPKGSPASFTIKVTDGFRRSVDATAGLVIAEYRIRFLVDDWQARFPAREPQKGDRVEIRGKRYALQESVYERGIAGDPILYVVVIKQ